MVILKIMKKLLLKLGMLFIKWGSDDSEVEDLDNNTDVDNDVDLDEDRFVAEICFFVDENEDIYINCFYKEEEESKSTFAKLYTYVNCGLLSSETLEIIYHQCQEEGKAEEYLDLLAKISEHYQNYVSTGVEESNPNNKHDDPLVKPTQVIDGQEW